MVKIAIIGGGNVGSTLGKVFSTKAGHTIIYASRDPTADKVKQVVAATPNSSAESIEKAVKEADVSNSINKKSFGWNQYYFG